MGLLIKRATGIIGLQNADMNQTSTARSARHSPA
jgi:hypothetical protein